MTAGLEISVEQRSVDAADVAFVRVEGEVDLANADELADAIRSTAVTRPAAAVVDLAGVPFMDSSGLRVLLAAVQDGVPRILAVVAPDSPVARLLDLAEVTDRVPIFASEREALEAVPEGEAQGDG